jgi:glycosyltransferase involved in cell wall biosynthesis
MRIAFASTFPPYRGGIAQFNQRLNEALLEAGHEVLCTNWKRQYPRFLFPGASQLTEGADLSSGPLALLDSIDPRTWKLNAQHLLAWQPDVLLVPFWQAALTPALVGVINRMKAQRRDLLVIGLMHNATSHDAQFWDVRLTKRFLDHVDQTWTLSEQVAERLSELVPEQTPSVFFHPIYDQYPDLQPQSDARNALHLPSSTDCDVLLFFGLIRTYKGLHTLIRAMDFLQERKKPVHLVIAGESYDDWQPYADLILAGQRPEQTHVHARFILDEELPTFFGACDAVCLPYLKASQSGVTAIALHYGKPVVASDVGGLAEYLSEPGTGVVCEPNSPELLAQSIEEALDALPADPKAFDAARARYSWEKLAESLTSELSALQQS